MTRQIHIQYTVYAYALERGWMIRVFKRRVHRQRVQHKGLGLGLGLGFARFPPRVFRFLPPPGSQSLPSRFCSVVRLIRSRAHVHVAFAVLAPVVVCHGRSVGERRPVPVFACIPAQTTVSRCGSETHALVEGPQIHEENAHSLVAVSPQTPRVHTTRRVGVERRLQPEETT